MSGAGGFFASGTGWYRKQFTVPLSWQKKCISIYFEGVYMNSEVFVNGYSLGVYPYGYSSFAYQLNKYLIYGKKNTIAVKVDNSQQINCRWYSGSGIYRHVWLFVSEPIHIPQWGVSIVTRHADENLAQMTLKTTIKNETNTDQKIILKAKIISAKNQKISNETSELIISQNSEKEITQNFSLKNPVLWSLENPQLYTATLEVVQQGKIIHLKTEEFGIRTIAYSSEKGFLLNGKSIKLNGGCVHHDHGCLGAASYNAAEERKVRLLKSAGFNAVRTSHNPPSEAFLNYCDKMGLLVIDESFDGWRTEKNKHDYAHIFDNWWKQDVSAMVLRDRNHPSVIMWSVGNEIIERTKPEAIETARKLIQFIHKIDSTRPVTSAMTTWGEGWQVFDSLMAQHDICGYNYQLHEAEKDHSRVPSRVILQTESYPRDAFKNWNAVQNQNYVIGDFVWTAIDYLGESGIGRWFYPNEPKGEHWESELFPWHGAYCGDIDITGRRKPISHYRNMLWNKNEKLYAAVREPNPENGKITETMWAVYPSWESWSWEGHDGKPLDVEIYSKYQKVKLYLNNQLIAEKETNFGTEFKTIIPVNYTLGELKIMGIDANGKSENIILKTASEPKIIKLTSNKNTLKANGQDLAFITIDLMDKTGILNPNADNLLHFEVEGEATIVASTNANMKDTRGFTSNECKAWKGRAMVVIRSKNKAGKIKLIVKSNGLINSKIMKSS